MSTHTPQRPDTMGDAERARLALEQMSKGKPTVYTVGDPDGRTPARRGMSPSSTLLLIASATFVGLAAIASSAMFF